MDANLVKYLTSHDYMTESEVIDSMVAKLKVCSDNLNNALEHDKYGVVGREAQKIIDLVAILAKANEQVKMPTTSLKAK